LWNFKIKIVKYLINNLNIINILKMWMRIKNLIAKMCKKEENNKEIENKNFIDNVSISKEKGKKEIYDLFTDIHQNMERDETRGLYINYLEIFIDSIFPDNIPNFPNEIKNYIKEEIKKFKNNNYNSINLFKLENFDKGQIFCFICVIKRIDDNTCDIIYKLKIINQRIENIKKFANENEEFKQSLIDFKENELKQLNENIMN